MDQEKPIQTKSESVAAAIVDLSKWKRDLNIFRNRIDKAEKKADGLLSEIAAVKVELNELKDKPCKLIK